MFKRSLSMLLIILFLFGCNAETISTNSNSNHHSKNINKLLQVHYINVGQGDATLFTYDNHAILYDTGDWKGKETSTYLKEQDITHLDLVIISHPDADHIGQLKQVLENFTVDEVWMSGNTNNSKTFQNALQAVLDSGADYYEPRAGDNFQIGDMTLEVVHPEDITNKANEESIGTLFTYGHIKFLFTGDADKKAEKEMISRSHNLKADILQLGHHGSNTSTDETFINAVKPDIAIYSAGANNSYGHPHKEIIDLLNRKKIQVYGTDVHGTIIVQTDGNSYSIDTKKNSSNKGSHADRTSSQDMKAPNCVNINTASKEDLQQIKHIGPARANELIKLRPFTSIDDLIRINGIGDNQLEEIHQQGIACTN